MTGPFYIINKHSDYQRQARHGGPQSLHLSGNWENRQYAERFSTKEKADKMLAYWRHNNQFEGRVIDHQTAMEMGDD
ncbi:hypothetical protein EVC26_024 [Rhizobium phage RHph_I72]|nr:hypothetical protein EVC26_024 [Rhizobium phage RHph_I72]